ncbi:MAG: FlgD immunoglobulin-like domain containing protein, partial [Candidatus Eiseniibacteriota bacterium]
GAAGDADVDGGKTTLFSPVFDLEGYEAAAVDYWLWYTNDRGNSPGEDTWLVQVTSDGQNWETLESTTQSTNAWVERSFVLSEVVELTSTVQLRFVASDYGSGSLVEAAIDDFVLSGMEITVDTDPAGTPGHVTWLERPSPNPFNPRTSIHFELAEGGRVTLRIFDVTGRQVRTLVDGALSVGRHALDWDGRNDAGRPLASGTYYLRLEPAGSAPAQVRRLTLVR